MPYIQNDDIAYAAGEIKVRKQPRTKANAKANRANRDESDSGADDIDDLGDFIADDDSDIM